MDNIKEIRKKSFDEKLKLFNTYIKNINKEYKVIHWNMSEEVKHKIILDTFELILFAVYSDNRDCNKYYLTKCDVENYINSKQLDSVLKSKAIVFLNRLYDARNSIAHISGNTDIDVEKFYVFISGINSLNEMKRIFSVFSISKFPVNISNVFYLIKREENYSFTVILNKVRVYICTEHVLDYIEIRNTFKDYPYFIIDLCILETIKTYFNISSIDNDFNLLENVKNSLSKPINKEIKN